MFLATEKDRKRILEFCSNEPEFNLFLLGDVEHYGFDNPKCRVFYNEDRGNINALVLSYLKFINVYTREDDIDVFPVQEQINNLINEGAIGVSGKKASVDLVEPLLIKKPDSIKSQYFAKCEKPENLEGLPIEHVTYAVPEDAAEIVEMFERIPEFNNTDRDEFENSLRDGSRKTTILRVNGKIISTASLAAENSKSGMIIGVATDSGVAFRKKGYASACTFKIVDDLFKRGKSACLFFDNPKAASIYHRIGFKDIGFWKMLDF